MVQKLDSKEPVSFKEMMMANSAQMDNLAQLLIEKSEAPPAEREASGGNTAQAALPISVAFTS